MSFLRTILILIIFYYAFQIFTRYIIPALFGRAGNDSRSEFERQRRQEQKKAARHEGEVTIESGAGTQSGRRSGKGEYVDYEEVKD